MKSFFGGGGLVLDFFGGIFRGFSGGRSVVWVCVRWWWLFGCLPLLVGRLVGRCSLSLSSLSLFVCLCVCVFVCVVQDLFNCGIYTSINNKLLNLPPINRLNKTFRQRERRDKTPTNPPKHKQNTKKTQKNFPSNWM